MDDGPVDVSRVFEAMSAVDGETGGGPFKAILDQLPVPVYVRAHDGRPFYANSAAVALFGRVPVPGPEPMSPLESLMETHPIVSADTGEPYPKEHTPVVQALKGIESSVDDMAVVLPDRMVYLEVHGAPIFDDEGRVAFALVVLQDITERRTAQREADRLMETQHLLLDSSGSATFGVDLEGRCTFANPAAGTLLGHDPEHMVGRNIHSLIHHSHADGSPYPAYACPMTEAFRNGTTLVLQNEILWRQDRSTFPADYRSQPILRAGQILGTVVNFNDATDRQLVEAGYLARQAASEALANTDALTGIGNRRHAEQLLESVRPRDAVMLIDLDNFKSVNDEHGHERGDEVLRMLGRFFTTTLRSADDVGRWGGEEFLVLLHDVGADAPAAAQRVISMWREWGSGTTFSAGVAVQGGGAPADTFGAADRALYRAKDLGRDRVEIAP